ncbi:MAG TPA: hypothetical protein PK668_14275 [Myxococcota bacterium]|nr:hypothetical protein [Myxococcota bacterium]HRY93971.1 hypothetical protein [Myxococcota bacterium]
MGLWIGVGVGAGIFFFLLLSILRPNLDRLVARAVQSGELGELQGFIEKRREGSQPAAYNYAIRRLWDGYHRELAARLARELARNFGTVPIAQYWLQQILQVEPAIASEQFDQEFLATYFVPEVAARCGKAG